MALPPGYSPAAVTADDPDALAQKLSAADRAAQARRGGKHTGDTPPAKVRRR